MTSLVSSCYHRKARELAEHRKSETDRAEAQVLADREAKEQAHRAKVEKARREEEERVRQRADALIFGKIDAIAQEQRIQRAAPQQSSPTANKKGAARNADGVRGNMRGVTGGAAATKKSAVKQLELDPFGDFIVLRPNPKLAANVRSDIHLFHPCASLCNLLRNLLCNLLRNIVQPLVQHCATSCATLCNLLRTIAQPFLHSYFYYCRSSNSTGIHSLLLPLRSCSSSSCPRRLFGSTSMLQT
jgi:hypothetical protein